MVGQAQLSIMHVMCDYVRVYTSEDVLRQQTQTSILKQNRKGIAYVCSS